MKHIASILRSFLLDEQGSQTVEFVIVMPVLLTALVFAYEFGRALFAYEVITSDVESAVRYISRASTTECPTSGTPSGNDIVNAQNLAECAQLPSTGTPKACSAPHFPWNSSSGATLTVSSAQTFSTTDSSGDTIFNSDGNIVQVKAQVPLTLSLLGYMGINTAYTLVVSDQARCMGG